MISGRGPDFTGTVSGARRPVRLDYLFFFVVACVLQLTAGVACAWQGKGTCPIDCDCDEVVL